MEAPNRPRWHNNNSTAGYANQDTSPLFENSTLVAEVGQDNFRFVLFWVIVPLLFGLITLVGVVGNILVIYVILSKKKMRTVTNLLLLNLAFADLSFVVICPPFTAYQWATMTWPFGNVACKLMHYLLNVTAYVTVYTLVLISVIRYLTIVHNVSTMRFRTKQNIIIMIVAIWSVMLSLNIPIFLSYGYHKLDSGSWDCDNFGVKIGQRLYATFFAFAYILPLTAICILSICILKHIQKQRPAFANKRKMRTDTRKKQASRLIILVVVIFALFWLPVHIHLLIAYFGTIPQTKAYVAISVLWNLLAYCNSCVNPIIYNYASKDFRDSFREVMFCIKGGDCREHPNDATVITRLTPEGQENHLLSDDEGKLVAKSKDVTV